jgi:hypothetical protein
MKAQTKKRVRLSLDLTEDEDKILANQTHNSNFPTKAEYVRTAIKVYTKLSTILKEGEPVYIKSGDGYDKVYILF